MIPKDSKLERYNKDLQRDISEWNDFSKNLVDTRSIFIVIGTTFAASILDRMAAELIRAKIDSLRIQCRLPEQARGFIIPDITWQSFDSKLKDNPVIAVGGPLINSVSRFIHDHRDEQQKISPTRDLFLEFIYSQKKILLYGNSADETREAVEIAIKNQYFINHFRKIAWNIE